MPSYIRFSALEEDGIKVNEDVDEVARLCREAKGQLLTLTTPKDDPLYVNPDRIAYLRAPRSKAKASVHTG
jgi:hypothetical protein